MFNAGMLGHLNQQQQMALLQMAQLQMAQMNNLKAPGSQPLSMVIPGAGQYVLVPQNQLQQMQQFQDAQLRNFHQQTEMSDISKRENDRLLVRPLAKPLQKQPVKQTAKPQGNKGQPRALPKRVLVTNLPSHIKTVEALADVFYPYGIISEIQIFKDKNQMTDSLVEIIGKVDPRINATPAATVEFETSQAAKFAVSIMRKREKQLQFRVALLKGDTVDEKHCHNYQKMIARRVSSASSGKTESENDAFSSSGYDTCSLKSESPRPGEKQNTEQTSDYFPDQSLMQTFGEMSVHELPEEMEPKRNLGPIAPPKNKKNKGQKTGQLSRFRATYKGPLAL